MKRDKVQKKYNENKMKQNKKVSWDKVKDIKKDK